MCVIACDVETSTVRRARPTRAVELYKKKKVTVNSVIEYVTIDMQRCCSKKYRQCNSNRKTTREGNVLILDSAVGICECHNEESGLYILL